MLDWSKPIQTRDGRKAEFLREIKTNSPYTHYALVTYPDGSEMIWGYTKDGIFHKAIGDRNHSDIIQAPVECTIPLLNICRHHSDDDHCIGSTCCHNKACHQNYTMIYHAPFTFIEGTGVTE
jgi:hypothetical protein